MTSPLQLAQEALADDEKVAAGPWEVDDTNGRAVILTEDGYSVAYPAEFANVRTSIKHGRDNSLGTAEYIARVRTREPALARAVIELSEQVERLKGENYDIRRWSDAPMTVEIYKGEAARLRTERDQLRAGLKEALDKWEEFLRNDPYVGAGDPAWDRPEQLRELVGRK